MLHSTISLLHHDDNDNMLRIPTRPKGASFNTSIHHNVMWDEQNEKLTRWRQKPV